MTNPKGTLSRLNHNLNILREREAKFGGNAPLELINQIDDHKQAITLTEQCLAGEMSQVKWQEALKPLILAVKDGQVINIEADAYIAGDVQGFVQTNYGSVSIIYNLPQTPSPAVKSETLTDDQAIPDCPYRGLFAFRPEHAPFFFGRQGFTDKLTQAVKNRTLSVVLGASGSGKSSLVFAGLVPALAKSNQWQFTYFRPGTDPFQSVAEALVPLYEQNQTEQLIASRRLSSSLRAGELPLSDVLHKVLRLQPDHRLLIVADQFEELYTLCNQINIRQQFLAMFLEAVNGMAKFPAHFVLTLRADFLGQASLDRSLADALQGTIELLGPMTRAELIEAIEQPATLQNVQFEAKLVDRLLDDVGHQEGRLPLLEFALTELWQRQHQHTLTHAAYSEIGEVKGALGRHADQMYRTLIPAEQQEARYVFAQLVNPDAGIEATRRLVSRSELETHWPLVTKLANERLVVTNRDNNEQETVELVHEALIQEWPQLQAWIEEDWATLRTHRRLTEAVKEWHQNNQDDSYLYRGARLAEVEMWFKNRPTDLAELEKDFIQVSLRTEKSVRYKIIVTFVLMGLIVAGLGVFIVTRLVSGSFEARLKNQLLDAGRVVSDGIVNAERARLEIQRAVANIEGVGEALINHEFAILDELISPLIANYKNVDSVVLLDTQGREVLRLQRESFLPNAPVQIYQGSGANFSNWPGVQRVLANADDGAKEVQIVQDPKSGEMIIFTIGSVQTPEGIVGAALVGTYLKKEMDALHNLALTDLTLFDETGTVIYSTLVTEQAEAKETFKAFTPERYQQVIEQTGVTLLDEIQSPGESSDQNLNDVQASGQTYRLAYTPFLLRSRIYGVYAVALPTSFITDTNNQSRNLLALIFTLSTIIVAGIGFWLSRQVIKPISKGKNQRSSWSLIPFILLGSCCYNGFCAQSALWLIDRSYIDASMISSLSADYSADPIINIAPLNSDIANDAIQDEENLLRSKP